MTQSTRTYFKNFFEEKEIPFATWTIADKNGVNNFIDSEVVIDIIKNLPVNSSEALKIRARLTLIDLHNAPVLPFIKHLATALVMSR